MYNFYTTNVYYNPLEKSNVLVEETIVNEGEEETSGATAYGIYRNGFRDGAWKIYNKKGHLVREDNFEKGHLDRVIYYPLPKFPSKEEKRREFLLLMEKRNP
jgi:hypothetical protein